MNELWSLMPGDSWSRFLLDAVWQSTLVGLVAWLTLRMLVRRAAVRAWSALLAIGLSLALPVLSATVRWTGCGLLPVSISAQDQSAAGTASEIALAPLDDPLEGRPRPVESSDLHEPAPAGATAGQPTDATAHSPIPRVRTSEKVWISGFWSLDKTLLAAWAAASLVVGLRLIASCLELGRLLRGGTRPCEDPEILAACREAAARLGLKRVPRVKISGRIALPALAGLGKVRLLVPEQMLQGSPPDWLNVFCHELAHLRRGDTWGRLLVELARVALPWQPWLWILGRQYHRACEEAADDWVVWTGTDPLDLATTLTNWAAAPSPRLAVAMAGMSEPRWRILRLIHLTRAANPRLGAIQLWGGTGVVAVLAGILALVQTQAPRVTAQELGQNKSSPIRSSVDTRPENHPATAQSPIQESAPVDPYGDPLPEGALCRLGTIRLHHRQSPSCMAFSPDGRSIASAAVNHDVGVYLWDVHTGKLIRHMKDPDLRWGWVESVAFSPDGSRLVSVSNNGGGVHVWEVASGRMLFKKKREGTTNPVAFSPDGTRFACGNSGQVYLCDASQGTEIKVFQSGGEALKSDDSYSSPYSGGVEITGLAFSPDGTLLAAGIRSKPLISIWNLQTGELYRRIEKPHGFSLLSLCFTADGKELISGGFSIGPSKKLDGRKINIPEVRLWDVASGKLARELDSDEFVRGCARSALSSNGKVLVTGLKDAILAWDVRSGTSTRKIPCPGCWGLGPLAISADGKTVAAPLDNAVGLWNVATGDPILPNAPSQNSHVCYAAYAPDASFLITAGYDGRIMAWNPQDGRSIWQCQIDRRLGEFGAALSPDGQTVATVSNREGADLKNGYRVRLWKARTGEHLRDFDCPGDQCASGSLAFSPDGKLLVGPGHFAGIRAWEIATGKKRFDVQPKGGGMSYIQAMVFSADSKSLYVADSTASVCVVDMVAGTAQRRFTAHLLVAQGKSAGDPAVGISSAAFTPDLKWLVTRQAGGLVVWDVASGKPVWTVPASREDVPQRLSVSPDGRLLAAVDALVAPKLDAGGVHVYAIDQESGNLRPWAPDLGWFELARQSGDDCATIAAFSPDNKRLVTGMDRGTSLVWDLGAVTGQ